MAAVGCGGQGENRATIEADSKAVLPNERLQDWVSYGDAVVVVRLISQTTSSTTPEEKAAGEGITSRKVVAEVVKVLWTRRAEEKVPDRLGLITFGSVVRGGQQTPIAGDSARLAIGSSYLMPIVNWPRPQPGWAPLYDGQIFAWSDGRVDPDAAQGSEIANGPSAAAQVAGKSGDQIAALLRATPPDPVAAANADLDAEARFDEVQRLRRNEE